VDRSGCGLRSTAGLLFPPVNFDYPVFAVLLA
jgi:hypothetical protein